jgi:hypothetical protein
LCTQNLSGKSPKKPASHEKRRNSSMKFGTYVLANFVGNHPLIQRKLPTQPDENE